MCTCDGICHGAQFYHYCGFEHRQWFEDNHNLANHAWGTDVNAIIFTFVLSRLVTASTSLNLIRFTLVETDVVPSHLIHQVILMP
jgi:hypothetical protein